MELGDKAIRRIFVYEFLSGGGATAEAHDPDDELLATGRAMRDAVADDLLCLEDYRVSVASCDLAAPVPAPATPVQPRHGESAFDFVERQADAHHLVWVVAPETAGVLSRFQRSVDPARWLGCGGAAIALASGKRATLLQLAGAGVTTPLAFAHAPEITRWVVKPDDGAGALGTRLHASLEAACSDWSQRSRPGCPMAIEPWVDGEPLSLSLMCGAGQTELLSINRQHLSIDREGSLSFRGVDVNVLPVEHAGPAIAERRTAARRVQRRAGNPPGAERRIGAAGADRRALALGDLASRVGRAIPGLCGFVGVDIVWHAQRGPVVIEVNPRVTCAYVGLSRVLRRNLAAEVIAAHDREAAHDGG